MFDIFKPLLFHVRKRIPQHALLEMASVESFCETEAGGLTDLQRQHLVAAVAAVWVCNSATAGKFQLAHKDFLFIKRAGGTAWSWLSPENQPRVNQLINDLQESGLIPK